MKDSIYVYPATLHPEEGGGYSIWFDDLPGCATGGDTIAEALYMGKDAMEGWLYGAMKYGTPIPAPSDPKAIPLEEGQITTLVMGDLTAYRRLVDSRAVKKTLTIPSWLNEKAEAAHVNYSKILQEALIAHLEA